MGKFVPDVTALRARRDERGIGILEAKREMRREWLIRETDEIAKSDAPLEVRFAALLDVVMEIIQERV